MQKKLNNIGFSEMPRTKQRTDAHCGPAVLEMLYGYLDTRISQNQIVKAAQIKTRLKRYWMNISEMAKAIHKLTPGIMFWSKQNANEKDLDLLINTHKIPVGVEWQGIFGKYADKDNGHYGVITFINLKQNLIQLADPFKAFVGIDRTFALSAFIERWWDKNHLFHPDGKITSVRDEHMMFILTKKTSTFPQSLNMQP